MAWVKLDDAMPQHPKVMAAGVQAFALDVAGICYSNKHATDGFIADYALPAVLPSLASPKRWANKLVEVGRWYRVEGGYEIHDVQDYQPTAAQQKELSKKRAEAGRRGGTKSGASRRSNREATAKQVASTEPNPVPSRPVTEEPKDQLLGGKPPEPTPVTIEVEGFDTPMPVKTGGGRTLTEALTAWCEQEGLEVPRHGPPQELTSRLLDVVQDTIGTGKHSHGCRVKLLGDLIVSTTGQDVPQESWGHLARLVSTHGSRPLLGALTTAITGGAGLTGEHVNDPLAITKYANRVLTDDGGRRHG